MTKHLRMLLVSTAFLLTGCAVGPLVSHETARTVGRHNSELIGGYGSAGYVFKWNYGLGEKFDLGLQVEELSLGIRGKYGIYTSPRGWSFAGAAGLGSSVGGSHYYGDAMASYLTGQVEPYGTFRLVHVRNDPLEFKDKDTGNVNFRTDAITYQYGQLIVGSRFWFSPNWLLSIEASSFISVNSSLTTSRGLLLGAAFGYHF